MILNTFLKQVNTMLECYHQQHVNSTAKIITTKIDTNSKYYISRNVTSTAFYLVWSCGIYKNCIYNLHVDFLLS